MWKKFERSAGTTSRRSPISANLAGPRTRPQVVNRRRPAVTEVPTSTRRVGGRTVTTVDLNPPPAAPVRARPKVSPEVAAAKSRWTELTGKLSSRDGKPYYPDRTYAQGDVLLHKRFGMGVVETVVHEEAVMVLFRDGQQVIEMAQAATR